MIPPIFIPRPQTNFVYIIYGSQPHTLVLFFLPQWNLWDVGWLGAPHGGAHELDDDYDDDD